MIAWISNCLSTPPKPKKNWENKTHFLCRAATWSGAKVASTSATRIETSIDSCFPSDMASSRKAVPIPPFLCRPASSAVTISVRTRVWPGATRFGRGGRTGLRFGWFWKRCRMDPQAKSTLVAG